MPPEPLPPEARRLVQDGLKPKALKVTTRDNVPHTRKRPAAKGVKDPRFPEHTQIVVRVEDELFADIYARAERQKTSFSEQVRILLEWGLDAAKQDAAA